MTEKAVELRQQILELTRQYHAEAFAPKEFLPGTSGVQVSGKVIDAEDICAVVESGLDAWFTTGRWAKEFERKLARFVGVRSASLVNSGSSANLVALSALCSPKLGDRQLKPGDEVITVAAGFPTTVNPIVQNRLVPVFLDVTIPGYEIDVTLLEQAYSPRVKAVMMAHTLGNVFDLDAVTAFCKKYNLWLVEDCCDALGSTWKGQHVGTFGDIATVSFYPAHHITMGEGGAVLTDKPALKVLIESWRDWGRDCWCEPGVDNTCGKRFDWQLGTLPCGYDHKYTYSHIGYNLKATDMQAALGVSQIAKLPRFIARRKENFAYLKNALQPLSDVLLLPEASPEHSDPSWFGFPIAVREDASLHPRRAHPPLRRRQDRHPPHVRRQPPPPARLPEHRVPCHRRHEEYRLRHEPGLLARRLPRPHRAHARLHRRHRPVLRRRKEGQPPEGARLT